MYLNFESEKRYTITIPVGEKRAGKYTSEFIGVNTNTSMRGCYIFKNMNASDAIGKDHIFMMSLDLLAKCMVVENIPDTSKFLRRTIEPSKQAVDYNKQFNAQCAQTRGELLSVGDLIETDFIAPKAKQKDRSKRYIIVGFDQKSDLILHEVNKRDKNFTLKKDLVIGPTRHLFIKVNKPLASKFKKNSR